MAVSYGLVRTLQLEIRFLFKWWWQFLAQPNIPISEVCPSCKKGWTRCQAATECTSRLPTLYTFFKKNSVQSIITGLIYIVSAVPPKISGAASCTSLQAFEAFSRPFDNFWRTSKALYISYSIFSILSYGAVEGTNRRLELSVTLQRLRFSVIGMNSKRLSALNLASWLTANRDEFRPPVGNKLLYQGEFKVMLVAGPNIRTDYHVECGEEWFYQLHGKMTLRVVQDGEFYDVHIAEGDTFCLPPGIPHSPQREPDSVGIVIERQRHADELDALQWYCQNTSCRNILFRKEFFCVDLGTDLLPIIEEYYSDEAKRSCIKCGFVENPRSENLRDESPPSQ